MSGPLSWDVNPALITYDGAGKRRVSKPLKIFSVLEPLYEALVDKKWTRTFAIELPSAKVFQPAHGNNAETRIN